MEIWSPIPGGEWEDFLVSNYGNVKRIRKRNGVSVNKLVTQRQSNGRYVSIWNSKERKAKSVSIGRLVLLAFEGPPPEGKVLVRHLNDVPNDNKIGNLAWGDYKDNLQDAVRNGKRGPGTEWSRKKSAAQLGKKKPSVTRYNQNRVISQETKDKISASLKERHKKNKSLA